MASRGGGISEKHGGLQSNEKFFAQIAHKVYPEHLRRFATTLLGIQDAKFSQITHGQENWDKCYRVRFHFTFCLEWRLPK